MKKKTYLILIDSHKARAIKKYGLNSVKLAFLSFIFLTLPGCDFVKDFIDKDPPTAAVLQVPAGYKIEKVAGGLSFPTGIAWDESGNMYISEAGGGFLSEPSPARIVRIEGGNSVEVVNLEAQGVVAPVVGFTWHKGSFYISHRASDFTGAVSRVAADGSSVNQILSGFIDSQSEHPLNDVRVGPDGRMYLAVGPAGNSAVMGPDVAPFIKRNPDLRTTAAQDLVLLGKNFETEDFRTDDPNDKVRTGAYVPFGVTTSPGQVIKGTNKPGGAIVSFDPQNAEGTLRTEASGLRNVIGLTWDHHGDLFAAVNGYDVRGARPVRDDGDPTYKIRKDTWYGWPDFSASLEPLTNPKFEVKDELQAMIYINNEPQGKNLGFVIDHEASGLNAPDKSLLVGMHPFHSSPSMLDAAPASWGDVAGHLFIAEWGDLTPPTDPEDTRKVGYRVVRLNPATRQLTPFVSNRTPGPASAQGAAGSGMERPFDVKFGPDGAMYIVDYGQVNIDMQRPDREGREPYQYVAGTGTVWKVTRMKSGK